LKPARSVLGEGSAKEYLIFLEFEVKGITNELKLVAAPGKSKDAGDIF
jgi:hypothetical protein